MDKQPALDADEVFTIVSHFDRLDAADAEAALRAAAELAGCPVGVRWSDAAEPTVWLEREGPARATDELLLHRLRHLLNRAAPAQGTTSLRIDDPALIELLLSGDAKPEERARAARLLGLDATRELRVLAISAPASARRILAKALPGQAIRAVTIGRVGALVCQGTGNTTTLSDHLNDVIVGEFPASPHSAQGPWLGIGSSVAVIDAPVSWSQAQRALRFASSTGFGRRAIAYERLSLLEVLADIPAERVREIDDVVRINQIASTAAGAVEVDTLEALCQYGTLRRTATELHLHHSTVAARIQHVEQLMGWNLDDPIDRFLATFALMLRRVSLSTTELAGG
ncbi:PucR family transcriptional regulator [Mycobacteroides immunogenum]|uniref:PucR protein n=1 Tax=Mycobacteroides immunogenum TaxID=83262 RepID=A0A7V8RV17_9MYCO|nr:helix-turn-helix domain-containing protein [Mycobacteroides immunogenum]AMT72293.1 pucR C-terminal helix-turn-helix domain protein [Mycobacteroides immunogenum]ANO05432.1 PucR protein [Mycobacteroides immunogenum]KIU40390.1 pucR C-terminal helix-turn-helix domain protein [Mycobacteroides immunogenum]KPG05831.1 PucR protein [Mycobacteroides immunogenum]KPG12683.1 PucR protein [Mycobacteroides immunogenum]